MNDVFSSVLLAEGPARELGDAGSLYDWLIGAWDVRVVDHLPDGSRRESAGTWCFRWILAGRAIQDVWMAPPFRCGTSIRDYHPTRREWRVTWINPVSGAHDVLVARRQGDDVVQEGRDAEDRPMRWVFTDIGSDSFRWYGERSADEGRSFTLEAEFWGRRRA